MSYRQQRSKLISDSKNANKQGANRFNPAKTNPTKQISEGTKPRRIQRRTPRSPETCKLREESQSQPLNRSWLRIREHADRSRTEEAKTRQKRNLDMKKNRTQLDLKRKLACTNSSLKLDPSHHRKHKLKLKWEEKPVPVIEKATGASHQNWQSLTKMRGF